MLDPDAQIRDTIILLLRDVLAGWLRLPDGQGVSQGGASLPVSDPQQQTTIFQPLTISTAIRTLNNPRYAGAYVYGRRHYRRAADGKKLLRKRERGDWLSCIPDAHPGYISWEQFQQNLKLLEANGRGYDAARASPPREGSALLQGRAVCGRCGRHLGVRYVARRGTAGGMVCLRPGAQLSRRTELPIDRGPPIDDAIGELIADRDDTGCRRTGPGDPQGDRSAP